MEERFDRLDRFRDQRDRRLDQFLETGRQLVDGCPVGDQDNGLECGAPVWISIRWAAGSAKRLSGCWKRTMTGRSPGKRLAVVGQSLHVRCVPPVAPLRRSPAGAVAEQQRRLQRPY